MKYFFSNGWRDLPEASLTSTPNSTSNNRWFCLERFIIKETSIFSPLLHRMGELKRKTYNWPPKLRSAPVVAIALFNIIHTIRANHNWHNNPECTHWDRWRITCINNLWHNSSYQECKFFSEISASVSVFGASLCNQVLLCLLQSTHFGRKVYSIQAI